MDTKKICPVINIYEDLRLEDAAVSLKGLEFRISLIPFAFRKQKKSLNLNKSSRLMTGSLLIITNSIFNPMISATVSFKSSD
jgi:hypothetical protein